MKDPCDECVLYRCEHINNERECPQYQAIELRQLIEEENQHEKDMIGVQDGHPLPSRWKL